MKTLFVGFTTNYMRRNSPVSTIRISGATEWLHRLFVSFSKPSAANCFLQKVKRNLSGTAKRQEREHFWNRFFSCVHEKNFQSIFRKIRQEFCCRRISMAKPLELLLASCVKSICIVWSSTQMSTKQSSGIRSNFRFKEHSSYQPCASFPFFKYEEALSLITNASFFHVLSVQLAGIKVPLTFVIVYIK